MTKVISSSVKKKVAVKGLPLRGPSFGQLEYPSPRDALCLVEIGPVVLETTI